MAVKVIVPSKTYSSRAFGVSFINGEGIFENEAEAERIASTLGYKVEYIKESEKPQDAQVKQGVTKKIPAKKAKAEGKKEDKEQEV